MNKSETKTTLTCDRCGFSVINSSSTEWIALWYSDRSEGDPDLDLCPDCAAEFRLWIAPKAPVA